MNPEELCKSGSEHGHQKALFCWANMACQFGFELANNMEAYSRPAEWRIKYRLYNVPVLQWLHAIPNAGARGNKVAAAQLKAEGVKAGVADIFLPVSKFDPLAVDRLGYKGWCHGLYIELKRANGKPSDCTKEQVNFSAFVISQGFSWRLCFGWREAAATIQEYLVYQLIS